MAQIIDNRTSTDQTVRIFDSFYSFDTIVNAGEYDIVHSYFISICDTVKIANNFTASLFKIAQETQIYILDLLDQIKGKSTMELNQIMAYYLNSFKSKTTLYGVSIAPKPNQPIARNIIQ